MDYSAFNDDYGYLMRNYRKIAKVLTDKLIRLREHSFRSRTAFLFGFSFGSRLIAKAGNDFGPKEIGKIDCQYQVRRKYLFYCIISIYYLQYVNQLVQDLKIPKQMLIQN